MQNVTGGSIVYKPQVGSPIVCFESRQNEEVRHESGGKDDVVEGKGHSLVQTAASTYDLPPLSTVVLKSRTPAGEWEAYGQTMNVELLTVNVTYSLFVAPSPEKDKPPTPYL